jgi:hypothetical protein
MEMGLPVVRLKSLFRTIYRNLRLDKVILHVDSAVPQQEDSHTTGRGKSNC